MNRMPTRNLPPAAEPWGRAVDNELAVISRTNEKQAQDTNNALTAINGTLTRLGEQVSEIRTIANTLVVQQATLEAQQVELESQQEILTTQQAQLTAQVAQISALVGSQIRGATQTASEYVNYVPDYNDYAIVSFTTPAGYTNAYVMSVSSAAFDPSGTNPVSAGMSARISGISSTQQGATTTAGNITSITASNARYLSLSPGEVFTCSARVSNPDGAGWVQTSAIAIFLR